MSSAKPHRVSGKLLTLALPSPAQLLMALEQGRNVKARRLNCSPFNQFLQNNTLIITLRDKMGFLYTRLCKLVNLDL